MATATKPPPAPANGRVERVEGWYPDPKTRPGQRYWDGKEWTAHLAPPGLILKLCCVTGAFAAVGIITAAVLAEIVDTGHVTMAGRIAAISAGLLFATLAVGFVASFYRNRMLKATSELQQPRDPDTGQFQSSG
jgi:hypothetical protein